VARAPALTPTPAAATALAQLERLRLDLSPATAASRLPLLLVLERHALRTAGQVLRLHELLCFHRAYPGEACVLAKVQHMLARFERRADLRAHRDALADSGIAGTRIRYRFFGGQALWLATRWPQQLRLDRDDAEAEARIAAALPSLLGPAEAQALAELRLDGHAALDRLRGPLTDAVVLRRLIDAQPGSSLAREALSDRIDAAHVLEPGPGTPSRTQAFFAAAPREPASAPQLARPDLRAELARAPHAMRRLAPADGQALADLAQAAMVTRARSLEAFSCANPADAWLVHDRRGDGLAFGLLGLVPGRRYAVPTLLGGLTLRNGVPIGYLQADLTGRSAAISFNTFDTFRGTEAAYTFARFLAALHHGWGSTSFTIEPYQLGWHNDEGLASGAWWFYAKLGFAPRDEAAQRLAAAERARLARRPGARSSPATLRRLAAAHLFFDVDPAHALPLPRWPERALAAGARLSATHGADRAAALQAAGEALRVRLGVPSWRGFSADQRAAWNALAPLVLDMDLERWSEPERAALVPLLRAKVGRSERDHLRRVIAHPRFEAALFAAPSPRRVRPPAGR
jgi:hypothetical protein